MARPAAVTPDAIRTTVLAMLAEAGAPAPASDARFRRIVSVRRLRSRLGAGDPATLSRHLNVIEAELVQAGLTGFAVPDVPPGIAAQMRALWEAAVATQLDGIVQLRCETEARVEASTEAQRNAGLKVELLRVELTDVRSQLSARDAELAVGRAGFEAAEKRSAAAGDAVATLRAQLEAVEAAAAESGRQHISELATERARYDGLSKQLLRETAHQRETFVIERQRLEGELARAAERVSALEALRERLLTELAEQRHAHQQAAAEAAALTVVVEQQRQTLALVGSAAAKGTSTVARRPARPAVKTAQLATPPATPVQSRPRRGERDEPVRLARYRLPAAAASARLRRRRTRIPGPRARPPLYTRWTLAALKRGCPSLADAKANTPPCSRCCSGTTPPSSTGSAGACGSYRNPRPPRPPPCSSASCDSTGGASAWPHLTMCPTARRWPPPPSRRMPPCCLLASRRRGWPAPDVSRIWWR
ncbi:DNA-binding protein [Paraburkholderia sp. CI3]|uniref:DNA-binding protein n=1 Tax=Paraburkholderia sp. CI3 TaxID=2991060 RepID=UPI003D1ADD96